MFRERLIGRFRPKDYAQELNKRLRIPKQKEGESVRAYADRYIGLYNQVEKPTLSLDDWQQSWREGLHEYLQRELKIWKPDSFEEAIEMAMTIESAGPIVANPNTKSKPLEKDLSLDIAGGKILADEAAGIKNERTHQSKSEPEDSDDPRFKEFYEMMGPQVTQDVEVDDLVKSFTAWKFYSRVEKDTATLRSLILKAEPGKRKPRDTLTCDYCKRDGHTREYCRTLKARSPSESAPAAKRALSCYRCGREGYIARYCSETPLTDSKPSTKSETEKTEKKASARRAKIEEEEEDPVSTSYMAKTSKKREFAEDPIEVVIKSKKKRTKKALRPRKTVDKEVLELFKRVNVPLELVAQHGAGFATQSKNAIREIYQKGREYRKGYHPIPMNANLSHALVVKGKLGNIPCDRLVIDPGSSVSIIDIQTARKGPIPI